MVRFLSTYQILQASFLGRCIQRKKNGFSKSTCNKFLQIRLKNGISSDCQGQLFFYYCLYFQYVVVEVKTKNVLKILFFFKIQRKKKKISVNIFFHVKCRKKRKKKYKVTKSHNKIYLKASSENKQRCGRKKGEEDQYNINKVFYSFFFSLGRK